MNSPTNSPPNRLTMDTHIIAQKRSNMRYLVPGARYYTHMYRANNRELLVLIGPQSRFGDNLLRIWVVCPPRRDCSIKKKGEKRMIESDRDHGNGTA